MRTGHRAVAGRKKLQIYKCTNKPEVVKEREKRTLTVFSPGLEPFTHLKSINPSDRSFTSQ